MKEPADHPPRPRPAIRNGSLGDDVRCPVCGYELRGTIAAGKQTCPECGWRFTDGDLRLLGPSDPKGRPRSLNPMERRVRGPWLIALFAAAGILFTAAIWLIMRQI